MMISAIKRVLPKTTLSEKRIKGNQGVIDIVNEVCNSHILYAKNYDKIAGYFWKGDLLTTAQKLFDFCKSNMIYRAESDNDQTVRSPQAILETARTWGVDCKHYAGFIAGVLDALKRQGKKVNWCYRFVSYDESEPLPGHVFVVANDGSGNNIFIDPVVDSLNQRYPKYYYKIDKFLPMLTRISGFDSNVIKRRTVGMVAPDELKAGGGSVNVVSPIVPYTKADPVIMNTQPLMVVPSIQTMAPIAGGAAPTAVPMEQQPAQQPQQGTAVKDNKIWWLLAAGIGLYFITKK